MTGIKTWRMPEILWILAQRRARRSHPDIYAHFQALFPRHQTSLSGVRYVWDKYKTDPAYNQEQHWLPSEIAFIIARHHAFSIQPAILQLFEQEFPEHEWLPHISGETGIEFVIEKWGTDPEYSKNFPQEEIKFITGSKANGRSYEAVLIDFKFRWPSKEMNLATTVYIWARHGIPPPAQIAPQVQQPLLAPIKTIYPTQGASHNQARPSCLASASSPNCRVAALPHGLQYRISKHIQISSITRTARHPQSLRTQGLTFQQCQDAGRIRFKNQLNFMTGYPETVVQRASTTLTKQPPLHPAPQYPPPSYSTSPRPTTSQTIGTFSSPATPASGQAGHDTPLPFLQVSPRPSHGVRRRFAGANLRQESALRELKPSPGTLSGSSNPPMIPGLKLLNDRRRDPRLYPEAPDEGEDKDESSGPYFLKEEK